MRTCISLGALALFFIVLLATGAVLALGWLVVVTFCGLVELIDYAAHKRRRIF